MRNLCNLCSEQVILVELCRYNLISRRVRAAIVAVGKGRSTYYIFQEHVCSFRCPACAILSYVACQSLLCFSVLSHKGSDFRNKKHYWTKDVCFDILYNLCLKYEDNSKINLRLAGLKNTKYGTKRYYIEQLYTYIYIYIYGV